MEDEKLADLVDQVQVNLKTLRNYVVKNYPSLKEARSNLADAQDSVAEASMYLFEEGE